MSRATLEKRPDEVSRMFDAVAGRYDVMNRVMTLGREGSWRRAAERAVGARPGMRILDLAAGTGASTVAFVRSGAATVACDFSAGMLAEGRRRHPELTFVAGDALRLPFRDASFDAVTVSFGLRNVASVEDALRELNRVARPGGRLVVLETATPPARLMRTANRIYSGRVMPRLARFVSSDPSSYSYLAESAAQWLTQQELAAAMRQAGWEQVAWQDLMFGVVAIHTAARPAAAED